MTAEATTSCFVGQRAGCGGTPGSKALSISPLLLPQNHSFLLPGPLILSPSSPPVLSLFNSSCLTAPSTPLTRHRSFIIPLGSSVCPSHWNSSMQSSSPATTDAEASTLSTTGLPVQQAVQWTPSGPQQQPIQPSAHHATYAAPASESAFVSHSFPELPPAETHWAIPEGLFQGWDDFPGSQPAAPGDTVQGEQGRPTEQPLAALEQRQAPDPSPLPEASPALQEWPTQEGVDPQSYDPARWLLVGGIGSSEDIFASLAAESLNSGGPPESSLGARGRMESLPQSGVGGGSALGQGPRQEQQLFAGRSTTAWAASEQVGSRQADAQSNEAPSNLVVDPDFNVEAVGFDLEYLQALSCLQSEMLLEPHQEQQQLQERRPQQQTQQQPQQHGQEQLQQLLLLQQQQQQQQQQQLLQELQRQQEQQLELQQHHTQLEQEEWRIEAQPQQQQSLQVAGGVAEAHPLAGSLYEAPLLTQATAQQQQLLQLQRLRQQQEQLQQQLQQQQQQHLQPRFALPGLRLLGDPRGPLLSEGVVAASTLSLPHRTTSVAAGLRRTVSDTWTAGTGLGGAQGSLLGRGGIAQAASFSAGQQGQVLSLPSTFQLQQLGLLNVLRTLQQPGPYVVVSGGLPAAVTQQVAPAGRAQEGLQEATEISSQQEGQSVAQTSPERPQSVQGGSSQAVEALGMVSFGAQGGAKGGEGAAGAGGPGSSREDSFGRKRPRRSATLNFEPDTASSWILAVRELSTGGQERTPGSGTMSPASRASPQDSPSTRPSSSLGQRAESPQLQGPGLLRQSSDIQVNTIRLRRESTGDRIVLLRQLVAPSLQKGDTATVLGEVVEYLRNTYARFRDRFLGPNPDPAAGDATPQAEGGQPQEPQASIDLRSQGYCVVPISVAERALERSRQ